MKVALVNNYYYLRGGSERVLFDDQKELRATGCNVLPFAPLDDNNHFSPTSQFFPSISEYDQHSVSAGIRAACNIIYSSANGRAFSDFLDYYRPDVIHCHNIYGRLTTSVLDQAQNRGIPVVLTAHDLKLVCPSYLGLRNGKPCLECRDGNYSRCVRWKCHKQSRVASLIYAAEASFNRWLNKYDAVSKILCPSHFMEESLHAAGISRERLVYHPNALNPDLYTPDPLPGNYILYAGRLSAEKGIMSLLEAIEETGLPLRIAGTGPLKKVISERIEQRQLTACMDGYCSGDALAKLFSGSAFTVVPSECYENASMAILESFAYGKPVVASALGGNPEIVADGQTGKLFSAGNVEELAVTLRALWNDRQAIPGMGHLARRRIEIDFSHTRRVDTLMKIYRSLSSG